MSGSKQDCAKQILIMHVFDFFETWALLQDKKEKYCRKLSGLPTIKGQIISLWFSFIKPNHLQIYVLPFLKEHKTNARQFL